MTREEIDRLCHEYVVGAAGHVAAIRQLLAVVDAVNEWFEFRDKQNAARKKAENSEATAVALAESLRRKDGNG